MIEFEVSNLDRTRCLAGCEESLVPKICKTNYSVFAENFSVFAESVSVFVENVSVYARRC
jgi:hypothetical protein